MSYEAIVRGCVKKKEAEAVLETADDGREPQPLQPRTWPYKPPPPLPNCASRRDHRGGRSPRPAGSNRVRCSEGRRCRETSPRRAAGSPRCRRLRSPYWWTPGWSALRPLAAARGHPGRGQRTEGRVDLPGVPQVMVEDQRDERHRRLAEPGKDPLVLVWVDVQAAGLLVLHRSEQRGPPVVGEVLRLSDDQRVEPVPRRQLAASSAVREGSSCSQKLLSSRVPMGAPQRVPGLS